jgi:hypothetical protein
VRELRGPIQGFHIGIVNRNLKRDPDDVPSWDDVLLVDFRISHTDVDYYYLMKTVFPTYIDAMQAYYAALSEEQIFVADATYQDPVDGAWAGRSDYVDSRHGVSRIWPANYWDRELCRRPFSLPPEEIVRRLVGKVAEVRLFQDGVILIDSYERVPDNALSAIDDRLRPMLSSALKAV